MLYCALALFSLTLVLSPLAQAQSAQVDTRPVYTGTFSNTALEGYDAVAYHSEGQAIRGHRDFRTQWRGAEWRFVSQDNLELFLADPDRYAPQYGGHCSWAMAQGYGAKGDPLAWDIVDGRLYLNYNREIQERWQQDPEGFITQGDENYPHVLSE
ncbi:YHS domain-containing (seleno)protein [Woodsholea maritima]|uniref:YHS domain-containing (seleno)protein n=1 Tax=Woodsholea maritima TaxID=240237 RepID=UPI000364D1B9|nr:YHS domain-containing (seleno)protein [Woodsholea maritima]